MEWPKLKNIILCILIFTNLFLLAIVARRDLQDGTLRSQARENAIQFLQNRGVQTVEAAIPHEVTLLPQSAARDLEREAVLADKVLGGGGVQTAQLGGEVYRYSNENGYLQFHSDGAFQGEFVPGLLPLGADLAEGCQEVLAKLEFEGSLLEEGDETLYFRQIWEEQPIFNHTVTAKVKEGCLTALVGGRRLVGQPMEDSTRSTITVPTALVQFVDGLASLNDVCSCIDAITQGYITEASLSGSMTLTPVWRIHTDTGSYQMNLITGTLNRLTD